MYKRSLFIPFIFTVAAMLVVPGCSPAATTQPPGAAVAITYSGAFAGQTASGLLKLVIDVTIENEGYKSFNISPERFSVTVNNYFYRSSESDLPAVDLPDGEKITGKLSFQVPPVAATTRVGYQLAYSGQDLHRIQWLKQANSPVSSPVSNYVISISYSGLYKWVKESRSLYLLVDMTIENRGYESFNTSPEYFKLVLGDIAGPFSPPPPISFDGAISDKRDGAYSDWRSYDLQNGAKLSGTLAFPIPIDIIGFYTEIYRIEYSGLRSYNIQWTKTTKVRAPSGMPAGN